MVPWRGFHLLLRRSRNRSNETFINSLTSLLVFLSYAHFRLFVICHISSEHNCVYIALLLAKTTGSHTTKSFVGTGLNAVSRLGKECRHRHQHTNGLHQSNPLCSAFHLHWESILSWILLQLAWLQNSWYIFLLHAILLIQLQGSHKWLPNHQLRIVSVF